MAAHFPYDVFLNHNAQDKPCVRRLAERLKQAGLQMEAGLRLWFDEWIVHAGDIIALKVDEGLEQSRVLLLCISPNALASGWVALERSTAIHRDPSNEDRRFIPLLLTNLPKKYASGSEHQFKLNDIQKVPLISQSGKSEQNQRQV